MSTAKNKNKVLVNMAESIGSTLGSIVSQANEVKEEFLSAAQSERKAPRRKQARSNRRKKAAASARKAVSKIRRGAIAARRAAGRARRKVSRSR